MSSFLWGVFGVLFAMFLVLAGFVSGWISHDRYKKRTTAAVQRELSEREKRERREEAQAFDTLVNYNPDIAYGRTPPRDYGSEV